MGEPHLKALAKAEAEGIALPQTVEALRAQASAFLLKTAAKDKAAAEEEANPLASWFGGGDPADKGPPVPEYYVPSRYLPAFWPLFFLGAVATLHALAVLLQVWLVDVRCWVRFRRVDSVHKATHVKVGGQMGKRGSDGSCHAGRGSGFDSFFPCPPPTHSLSRTRTRTRTRTRR